MFKRTLCPTFILSMPVPFNNFSTSNVLVNTKRRHSKKKISYETNPPQMNGMQHAYENVHISRACFFLHDTHVQLCSFTHLCPNWLKGQLQNLPGYFWYFILQVTCVTFTDLPIHRLLYSTQCLPFTLRYQLSHSQSSKIF